MPLIAHFSKEPFYCYDTGVALAGPESRPGSCLNLPFLSLSMAQQLGSSWVVPKEITTEGQFYELDPSLTLL